MNKGTVAVFIMSLKRFENSDLAALNNAVQTFGRVPQENDAYSLALQLALIDEEGNSGDLESLRIACGTEVNRRVEAGTFN